jgi:hypothetical protein
MRFTKFYNITSLSTFLNVILILLLIILCNFNIYVHAGPQVVQNSKNLIRIDKSKIHHIKCNDYMDRFLINITYLSSEPLSNKILLDKDTRINLFYKPIPCFNNQDTKECEAYKNVSDLSLPLDQEFKINSVSYKFFVNSFYKYKFKLSIRKHYISSTNQTENVDTFTSISADSFGEYDICNENLTNLEFKFGICDEYMLNLNDCKFELARPTPKYRSYAKYIYMFVGLILFVFVAIKLFQVVFFRYKLLNN